MYLPLREINANIFIIFASLFLKKTLKIKLMSPLFSILHSHSPLLDVTPLINMAWTQAIVYLMYICFSDIEYFYIKHIILCIAFATFFFCFKLILFLRSTSIDQINIFLLFYCITVWHFMNILELIFPSLY